MREVNLLKKNILTKGLSILFILTIVTPMSLGYNIISEDEKESQSSTEDIGILQHQWPLYGHDAQNTCLSEYDTSQNQGYEKWKFFVDNSLDLVAPVIDSDGTLYITSFCYGLFAIYPNGTLKWHRELFGFQEYQPAIGLDGTIYAGTGECFHAFYPNGTLKWVLPMEKRFSNRPVVSPEGVIYVGTTEGSLYAVYPNGSIKWEYYIGYRIIGPSIDAEGNIYFQGLYDEYLYSLDENGSLRWTFYCVEHPADAPLIGSDGTIYYVPVYCMIAVNPDGSEKWRIKSVGSGRSPGMLPDGTIVYSPSKEGKVYGINPADGSINWTYDIGFNPFEKTRAAVDKNGLIYFAYTDADYWPYRGYFCALNSDGTFRWKTRLSSDIYPYDDILLGPTPSIGADGTVYVTTQFHEGSHITYGYVHAIGELKPDLPSVPDIDGPKTGRVGVQHEYVFKSVSPVGKDLYYFIDWGDESAENWIGPYPSGEEVIVNHTWDHIRFYSIEARAKDTDDVEGLWGFFDVEIPRTRATNMVWYQWFLERFPLLERLLRLIFDTS